MKFENIKIEFEKYESLDIVASSPEDTTDPSVVPTQPSVNNDPYENDKW